jgi:hypothetical protein
MQADLTVKNDPYEVLQILSLSRPRQNDVTDRARRQYISSVMSAVGTRQKANRIVTGPNTHGSSNFTGKFMTHVTATFAFQNGAPSTMLHPDQSASVTDD